jgi:hypothetical protein
MNILMYRSKSSKEVSVPTVSPRLRISMCGNVTIAGGLLIAFLAKQALRRGVEVGAGGGGLG